MDQTSSSLSTISYEGESSATSFSINLSRKSSQKSLRNIKLPPLKETKPSSCILLTEVETNFPKETYANISLRDSYAVSMLEKFFKSSDYRQFQYYVNDSSRSERYFDISILKKVIDLFEKAICCFQFSYNYITTNLKDSSFHIYAIESQESVAKVMGILLPELIRFPHAFYKKLEVRVFTFCNSITRLKNTDKAKINKKLYNWLFLTKEPINARSIKRHFYKSIWFNLKRFYPNVDNDWVKNLPRKSDNMAIELFYGETKKYYLQQDILDLPDILEDQFEIFCSLMENPRITFGDNPVLSKKLRMMKKVLEGFDLYL